MVPTVSEYMPRFRATLTKGSTQAWSSSLDRIEARLGDRPLDEVWATDVMALAQEAGTTFKVRRGGTGLGARENLIAAARSFLTAAQRDGYLVHNPARLVRKPPRGDASRHALSNSQIRDLARSGSPQERLMVQLLMETGIRREGLIGLEPTHLRYSTQCIEVIEKNRKRRVLPISLKMTNELANPNSSLYGWTRRKLDTAWGHYRVIWPWAAELGISCHWMRHTAITWMERNSSYAVAATWAGHAQSSVTQTYITVQLPEVVHGWRRMTHESHPLHECPECTFN
jgi:integrase/recombinase XerC